MWREEKIYSSLCEEPSKRKQWALYSLTKRIISVSWVLVRLPNEPTCAALTHISSSHPHLGFKAGPTVQQSEGCLKAEVSTSISLTHNAIWSMGSNKCNHRIIIPSFSLQEEDAHLCRFLTVNERLMRKRPEMNARWLLFLPPCVFGIKLQHDFYILHDLKSLCWSTNI